MPHAYLSHTIHNSLFCYMWLYTSSDGIMEFFKCCYLLSASVKLMKKNKQLKKLKKVFMCHFNLDLQVPFLLSIPLIFFGNVLFSRLSLNVTLHLIRIGSMS